MYKRYSRNCGYSYALGAFPTFELLQNRPEQVLEVIIHPSFLESTEAIRVQSLLASQLPAVPLRIDAKAIQRLSPKENCYLIGIFATQAPEPLPDASHLLLVNPMNMGNVGTIMRTMLGFAVRDLVLLQPAMDHWDPRVVRASMGAIFSLRIGSCANLAEYLARFPDHAYYPLMLQGRYALEDAPRSSAAFALILGNEAHGLDDAYADLGCSLVIPHAMSIDSLNITVAAGIALESFYRHTK